jgi:hypothetical protein
MKYEFVRRDIFPGLLKHKNISLYSAEFWAKVFDKYFFSKIGGK